jgi:two-component system chemotaxis response regulator CheY
MTDAMDAEPAKASSLKILVVDDRFDSRQLLMRMLRAATDATVVEARNGDQAIQSFIEHRPDLVFLDIDMPEVDGMAALAAIRGLAPDARIVMVSGTGSATHVKNALSLGVAGFVVKPFSAARIASALEAFERDCGRAVLRIVPAPAPAASSPR